MQTNRLITAVEAHAEGEPGRVITGGVGPIPGDSVFAQMQWLAREGDELRQMILTEPRGYPALCANILVPPCDPAADIGLIIMEQTEYPPMSGSNVICAVTVILETGILPMVEPETQLVLETPAGLIRVTARCHQGKVRDVAFQNVPAFAVHLDAEIDLPGFGRAVVDIAWGGMFFVVAEAAQFGLTLAPDNGKAIVRLSEALRHAAADQLPVRHPDNPAITGPTITQLTGPPPDETVDGQSVVTLSTGPFDPTHPEAAAGSLDRSPCGTGTCAKMAILHAKNRLEPDTDFINAGPLGTRFKGRIVGTTTVGPYPAIIPTLSGRGWIYGTSQFMRDPSDPFPTGYTVGDLW